MGYDERYYAMIDYNYEQDMDDEEANAIELEREKRAKEKCIVNALNKVS